MPWLLSERSRIALRSRPWPIRVDTYPYLWLTGRGAPFINKRRIRRGLRDVQESSLYRRDLIKRSTTLSDINYRTLSDTAMKTMAKENADPKDLKRVPKPQMEKRRRDRINQSLETLRLLLLENTKNEKLRNPKVEKAAILESVVQFLKAEQGAGGTASGPQPTGSGAQNSLREEGATPLPAECNLNYREGMRMCLRRVGHFIAAKSRELEGSMDGAGGHPNPLEHAGPLPQSVIPLPLSKPPSKTRILAAHSHLPWCGPQPAPELDPSAHVPPQRLSPCPLPSYPLEVLPKPGGVTGDAVWRPWPQ